MQKRLPPSVLRRSSMKAQAFIDVTLARGESLAELLATLSDIMMILGGHEECFDEETCPLASPRISRAGEKICQIFNREDMILTEVCLILAGILQGMAERLPEDAETVPASFVGTVN